MNFYPKKKQNERNNGTGQNPQISQFEELSH